MAKQITPEQVKMAGALLKQEHEGRKTAEAKLEKAASDAQLRERAEKVAFKEVELGIAEPFKNHEEFQQKVASLMTDDLDVVEKALSRGYRTGGRDGELDNVGDVGKSNLDPLSKWILHGEL